MSFYTKLLVPIILIIGCGDSDDLLTAKEGQIVHYLKNSRNIILNRNTFFFVINGVSSECRPCDLELVNIINTISNSDQGSLYDKYLLTNEKKHKLFNSSISTGIEPVYDTEYNLSRHGFDLAFNIFIEFDSRFNIVYWRWLTPETFDEIIHRYNKKIKFR